MQASDIMTTDVVSVPSTATVFEAAALMAKHHISGLPVVGEDGSIVGIISEGDLLHRVETGTGKAQRSWLAEFLFSTRKLAVEYLKENALKVSDIMTENVVSVLPATELAEVAYLLERHHQLIAGFRERQNMSASGAGTGSRITGAGSGKVRISEPSRWLEVNAGRRYL